MMTLLPKLCADNAGLVAIYNDRGTPSLQFWRSVFERRAPESLPRVEQLATVEVGQGKTTYEVSEELLEALTDAYREAASGKIGWSRVSQQKRDRASYAIAKEFLLQAGADKGVTAELVERYLHISAPRPQTMAGLYERMLGSAQSANMKTGVIGGSIGGVGNLGRVLCDFDPSRVLEKYQSDWEEVLDDVVAQLKPRGSIRRTPRSIWPRYCRTILSGAKFLVQFESANDFYEWVDFFDKDERARAALPLLLDREIEGFGFALACDFVMGLSGTRTSPSPTYTSRISSGP
jgi:hypothetical protein